MTKTHIHKESQSEPERDLQSSGHSMPAAAFKSRGNNARRRNLNPGFQFPGSVLAENWESGARTLANSSNRK